MKRKDPEMYKRNRGECELCGSEVGPFAVKTNRHNMRYYECHACQIKALLITEASMPKKKSIQEGLADAEAGRTSKVLLSSPFIP